MNTIIPPSPLSPSVGARRKGAKTLPRLPLSAFTPPNTGSSEAFPLPPSPSTLKPEELVDAYVIAPDGDLSAWKEQAGPTLNSKTKGVVLSLYGKETPQVEKVLQDVKSGSLEIPILAILVPIVNLTDEPTFSPPSYLVSASASKPALIPTAVFTKNEPKIRDALHWALKEGLTINIDVQCDFREASGGGWDALEEMLTSVTNPQDAKDLKSKIVISNVLPPPDDLSLPIVKLLTDSSYRNYQSHIAALSLFGNVYLNYLPPAWGVPVPSTTAEAQKERNEWKRRIKMYISPAVEAFGFQRIIFGSSPSSASQVSSNAADWYELARESFAELGVEQDAVDAVFKSNAQLVYES